MLSARSGFTTLGIIDLGSNSARLIVAQIQPRRAFRLVYEFSRRVRLAEGLSATGALQPEAMARAIETLQMFQAFCRANAVDRIIAVATAATRDASNGRVFLARVRAETGLKLRVLSGADEAFYGTHGAINALGLRDGLVLDLGGGSFELSRVRRSMVRRSAMAPLGAVRLTDRFLSGGRASRRGIKALRAEVGDAVAGIAWAQLASGEAFVGLGGTIRTLARLDRDALGHPMRLLNGYILGRDRLSELAERLALLDVAERARRIPGLPADRADIILAGALAVETILTQTGAERLVVSDQGLREGLLYEALLGRGRPPVIPDLRRFSVENLNRVHGYAGPHNDQVARLALRLFDALRSRHGLGAREREWLWAAAHLNDIGSIVNPQDHHRHSAYMILNAGLPGYDHRELALIAQLCTYIRKGKLNLASYNVVLEETDDRRVRVLGALLRLAEALDSSRTQDVADVAVRVIGARCTLTVSARRGSEVIWEAGEAARSQDLFQLAFGLALDVRAR